MNRWTTLWVAALLSGPSWALAEDWPTFRHDIRRSGYSAEPWNAASVKPVWTFRSSQLPQPAWASPARWDSYANVRGLGAMRNYDPCFHVIVAKGRLYFGSSADDSLYCLNAKTGEQQWTFTTDAPLRIAPTFSDGRLYFGSDDGHAYCVNAESGRLIWKSESIDHSQQIVNNGRFVSLSPCRTGVLVDNKTAYFAVGMLPWRESVLFAVDAVTGKSTGPGHFVKRHFGLTMEGALLASETKVLAPAGRVAPYVFRRADGKHLGRLEGSGGSSVVLTDTGRVLCGPGNKTGWISVTDVETRKQVAKIIGKTTAVITPKLRVLLSRFGLSAVDRKSKKIVWEASSAQRHELIVAGGTIFVGGDDAVAAYSLKDGRRLWEAPVAGKAFGLAVAGGLLYVSTDEGVIHCFGPGDGKTLRQVAKRKTSADSKPSPRRGGSDKADDKKGLIGRWLFHRNMAAVARRRGLPNSERRVADLSGQAHALIEGDIQIREVGGAEALQLDGEANSVLVTSDLAKARLPKNALTAEAWVRIDEPDSIGGVVGCFQDTKKQHKGWVLGCHHSRFVFALSATGGKKGFTYVRGKTLIRPGHWYHVAATFDGHAQTLYVNGRLDGRLEAQIGKIQYPDKGFYEIGAFHDQDTDYHLYGMVHEIRVYDRALPVETVERQFNAKRDRFAVPIDLEIGPVARFVAPGKALVRWKTSTPTPTRLVLNEGDRQRRIEDDRLKTDHEVLVNGLRRNRLLHYSIETWTSNQVKNTLEFELDTHFNFSVAPIPDDVAPFAEDDQSSLFADAAKRILADDPNIQGCSGIKQGICLVIGNGTGRLAWELIRQSELRVIGVETDAKKVASARQAFQKAGLYGSRVAVHQVKSLAKLPFVGRFANLVVSERLLTGGKPVGDKQEILRVLRPNGGVVAMGQPAGKTPAVDPKQLETWFHWFGESSVNGSFSIDGNGVWLKVARPALEGAGEWSHLYGRADNSAFGDEALAGASTTGEMRVQWVGRPGARAQPDRNGRKPSPLSTNGRLFVQGLHRVIAIDSFNGTILWALECPAWERFNMPRDCSNWCADDDFVYIAAKNKCWKINAATGDVAAYHPLVPAARNDWSYEWGYVGLLGNRLLGTAQKTGASFTSFWGDAGAGWYDARSGPSTFKVCSDKLFALEKKTGGVAWSYEDGVIINSTITAADDRVFFVESRNAKVKKSQSRRVGMSELWKDQFLVAIDLETGKKIWESPIDTADGTVAFYLAYSQDTLVIDASTNKKFEVSAFGATDGKFRWKQTFGWFEGKGDHGKAISRPAIVGGRVFVRPKILDLKTGEMMPMEMPKGKCGTYAATTNAMIFRTTKITLWNTSSGSASSWDRMRPGCWLSTIPAGGMLLSPEGGGGCSCGSWMEMSVGFMPGEHR